MNGVKYIRESDAEKIFEHVLDIIEGLEDENLAGLLRISELEKKIRGLREDKILLSRELERLAHKLEEAENNHEALTRRVLAGVRKGAEL